MVKRTLDRKSVLSVRTALLGAAMSILFCTATPSSALCEDKLLVKNEDGETTFRVRAGSIAHIRYWIRGTRSRR